MDQLRSQIITIAMPIVMAGLAWLGMWLKNLIQAKTQNEWLKGALVRADDTIVSAVRAAEQTIVADMKEANADGVVTADEYAKIKLDVMNQVKSHLGAKGLGELVSVLGIDGSALDSWLSTKVEAAVHDMHADSPAANSPT